MSHFDSYTLSDAKLDQINRLLNVQSSKISHLQAGTDFCLGKFFELPKNLFGHQKDFFSQFIHRKIFKISDDPKTYNVEN